MNKGRFPIKIEVTAYSGYRANERPLHFVLDHSKKDVRRIIKRWIEPGKDFFKVSANDGKEYILCWERDSDTWFLEEINDDYSDV